MAGRSGPSTNSLVAGDNTCLAFSIPSLRPCRELRFDVRQGRKIERNNNTVAGTFELGAQVSAVAVDAGTSLDASYNKVVAVFTIAEGGPMYEVSVGGQKFKYKKK